MLVVVLKSLNSITKFAARREFIFSFFRAVFFVFFLMF